MKQQPRLILAGLSGGSGKSILTFGLCRYWKNQGLKVKPFKKGPDYIDAAWMGRAAQAISTNLDPFLMPSTTVNQLFQAQFQGFDLGLIEGNRGLFDGLDIQGSSSTAELAKLLKAPVVIVIDCTKMTRTVAALIRGCCDLDKELNIAGVVFNRTAGNRHRNILRNSVEAYTDVPVIGALPKLVADPIPERHMGLVSDQEYDAEAAIQRLAQVVAENIDTNKLLDISRSASPLEEVKDIAWPRADKSTSGVRIGVVKDAALWFYYAENLEALKQAGAQIEEVSLLEDELWPEIDALYLGGGFPETQVEALSKNLVIRQKVYDLALSGLPIYAECGGLIYLCSEFHCNGSSYPMAGVFPICVSLSKKPHGHGYTQVKIVRENPFHPQGLEFTGHEFHYSHCSSLNESDLSFCMYMQRGTGMCAAKDGILFKNTFASYTHIHALGVPSWAPHLVQAAKKYKDSK